jgi:MoaA/NifB/PqqE/SkfB family radical SAM enzyme
MIKLYKKLIQPDLQRKRYKRVLKLLVSLIKFIFVKKPYILVVETGTVCNLNCPTCPTPREVIVGLRTATNMDFESFKKIMDNAHKSFSGVLLYWSNEPLLNKDILEMVRYCNKLNLYTFISTNLMLLSEKKFREFIDAGLDELMVCMDGFSAETYEPFRKGARFETVKKNIEDICRIKKELKTAVPWIEIQYIETKQNSKEISACKEWAKNIGIDGFHTEEIYVVEYLSEAEKLRKEFCKEKAWEERSPQAGTGICKNPNLQVCVLVDGQVTICCHDIKGACDCGNLYEDSFATIAKSEKYLSIKRRGKKRQLSICKRC